MSEVYSIVDVIGYVTQVRQAAADTISPDYNENLDNYISINQMVGLVNSKCLGFDNESRPMLDEQTNEQIFEEIAIWIHNVGLARLAANNLIECAWDDSLNEMVFWNPKAEENDVHTKNKRRKNKKIKGQDC